MSGNALESLPLEVLQQILSYLSPSDLASVRQTSSYLSLSATSNFLWQRHCLALWKKYLTLQDCSAMEPSIWGFSVAPNGWFRSYCTTMKTAMDNWLNSEEDLRQTNFMVLFKSHLSENVGVTDWHVLVEFRADNLVTAIDGLPFSPNRWYFVDQNKTLRVLGYPPCFPSRDPRTWCRALQHIYVILLADSPEFFKALVELHNDIMSEIKSKISSATWETMNIAFKEAETKILERRKACLRDRLKEILLARNSVVDEAQQTRAAVPSTSDYTHDSTQTRNAENN